MITLLETLNRTPGVMGSAVVVNGEVTGDFGDAIGGPDAAPLAARAAETWRRWLDASGQAPGETAVFVASGGRMILRAAGDATLVAFAENDASAGMLKLRMRDAAEQILAGTTA